MGDTGESNTEVNDVSNTEVNHRSEYSDATMADAGESNTEVNDVSNTEVNHRSEYSDATMGDAGESNTEVNDVSNTEVNHRSEYSDATMGDAGESNAEVCVKSCARRRYLPENLLFDILSHLPARVLLDVMRHVCREWDLIIRNPNFIRSHLRNSSSGIIIQKFGDVSGTYVEMRGGCLETSKFDLGFCGLVQTSCNGLVLAPPTDFRDTHNLYVINPLTKQRAVLPPYFPGMIIHVDFCLAFVEASMEYKVVHACCRETFAANPYIAVLTIGVDKVWRTIDIKHLSFATREALKSSPVVTGAYIHWTKSTFVLTFNVETETICQFPVPPQKPYSSKIFLPMGDSLSLVCGEFSREVWEMNPRTGKWIKLLTFDLGPLPHIFQNPNIIPFGWLAAREVLLFGTGGTLRSCVAYNIKTREVQPFEFNPVGHMAIYYHFVQSHVNSLVWLEGGF